MKQLEIINKLRGVDTLYEYFQYKYKGDKIEFVSKLFQQIHNLEEVINEVNEWE